MSELPEPLTPADCDLRGLHYMPLYGDRLFASATWIGAKPEAKVAALRLWWHSYSREVPAASLPDDDALLAEYAGYGVAVSAWRKIRTAAMRGWVKCADGRWYHPVVAEVVLEAWEARKRNREKQRQWREKTRAKDGDVTVTETVTETVTTPGTKRLRNAGEGKGEGYITPTPSKPNEAARFLGEIRKSMSATGNQRTKPKACEKLLPALIAQHGFDPLLAAAKAFYGSSEAQKDGGQFQCGLQVALGDGRIEALIKPAAPIDWPLRMKVWRESAGEEWPERWGPKPGQPGFSGPSEDLFTQGSAP